MEYNNDPKVIISTLTREEVKPFIVFLNLEKGRHTDAIREARDYVRMFSNSKSIKAKTMKLLYETAIARHIKDIESIYASIKQAKQLFNL